MALEDTRNSGSHRRRRTGEHRRHHDDDQVNCRYNESKNVRWSWRGRCTASEIQTGTWSTASHWCSRHVGWSSLVIRWRGTCGTTALRMTRRHGYRRARVRAPLSALTLAQRTLSATSGRVCGVWRARHVHASPTKRPDFRYRRPQIVVRNAAPETAAHGRSASGEWRARPGPGPSRCSAARQLSGQYGRISMTSSSSSGPPAAAARDTDISSVLFIAALWILIRRAPCRSCWRQVWHGHLQRRCSFKAARRWHLASTVSCTSSYDVTTSTASITVDHVLQPVVNHEYASVTA